MRDNVIPIGEAPSVRRASDTSDALYDYALRCLGARAMSSGSLRDKLRARDASEDAVSAVVERVIAEGYLDDHAFARMRIEKLRDRGGYADRAIRQRLMTAGVPSSVVDEVLTEFTVADPLQMVLEAARARATRMRGLDRETASRRLSSYLQRRGHMGSEIRAAVQQALDEVEDHPPR